MRILVVDDDPVTRVALARFAGRFGNEAVEASDGETAWRTLVAGHIDAVISDWLMPGLDGIELTRRIRQRRGEYVYVILATSLSDGEARLTGMRAGADDYLVKPLDPTDVQARLIVAARVTALHRELALHRERLERLNEREAEAARTDPLTQLGNRLRLEEDLAAMRARSGRYGHRYCVVLCDLDRFKAYNDAVGHAAGDEALRTVAATIRQSCRSGDTAYRYGGEEFVVIVPEQTLQSAAVAAERLRSAVEALAIPHPGIDPPGVMTMSVGVADLRSGEGMTVGRLVAEADDALYRAKREGRNRVVVAAQSG